MFKSVISSSGVHSNLSKSLINFNNGFNFDVSLLIVLKDNFSLTLQSKSGFATRPILSL